MAKTKMGKIHAILGRSHRTGRWRLSPKTSVVALLGSCRLDLRDAHLDGEVSKMTATVFLGGVTIIIPPGVEVRPSGLSLLGGASVDVPNFDDGEAALIEIEWTSIFGRLRIGAELDVEVEDGVEGAPGRTEGADTTPRPGPVGATTPPVDRAAPPTPETDPPPAIGFEDLDEPTPETDPPPAIGFEDLDEPTPETDPPPAIGFEDLDEPTPEADPSDEDEATGDEVVQEDTELAPAAVGFEDL